jgi:zinc transport system substrate-binding protein
MAEEGEMTADEYKTYYQNGYKTDITNIDIEGDHIEFTYEDGKKVGSDYQYVGYYIQNWSTGTKAAMYRFEAVDRTSGAPVYIEFNDHMIEPAAAEHFHIRMSNESFDAIVDPENSWPTFFPADMTGEEICEHMEGHDHEHEEEADEHVWLSLKNAETLVGAISDALQELDPDNKDTYAANASAYIEKLSALDGAYQSAVDGAARKTVLFGDRFPFRYLADDYGLSYYAAFSGCSAESEASFETVSFLAKKVDELKMPCVLTIEGKNHKLAETIVQSTAGKNQKVLTMDSMQSTTSEDVANGTTYLSAMEQNLSVLKEALG